MENPQEQKQKTEPTPWQQTVILALSTLIAAGIGSFAGSTFSYLYQLSIKLNETKDKQYDALIESVSILNTYSNSLCKLAQELEDADNQNSKDLFSTNLDIHVLPEKLEMPQIGFLITYGESSCVQSVYDAQCEFLHTRDCLAARNALCQSYISTPPKFAFLWPNSVEMKSRLKSYTKLLLDCCIGAENSCEKAKQDLTRVTNKLFLDRGELVGKTIEK